MAVIVLIMTLGTVTAQEYMFVWKTDGTSDTYRVSDLDSISFYMPGNIPDNTGGIGSFSVSATQKVTFSRGNLQYQASTGTWRFAVKQWQDMELNGAVFLPAAGDRFDNRMFSVGTDGHYWSSTRFDTSFACSVYFYFGYLGPQDGNDRSGGRSVRLVRDIPN